MKSRYCIILFITLYAVLLSGCGVSKYEKDFDSSIDITEDNIVNILPINQTASQIGMNSNQAVSDNGLYFIQDDRIFYYDFNTESKINWCPLSNCNHNNSECSSYIGDDTFVSKYIFFNDSKIYKISKDENGTYLEQYKEDGSEQVRIGKLWDKNSFILDDKAFISNGCIKIENGNAYFLIVDDYKKIKFCSMELKTGAIPQVISEYGAGSQKINVNSFMISNGFACFAINITNGEEMQQNIHMINLSDKTDVTCTIDTAYFGIKGNALIYCDPKNPEDIVSYNAITKEMKKIIDIDLENHYPAYYNNIICTQDYILLDNDMETYYGESELNNINHTYKIYDYNGGLIYSFNAEQSSLVSFDGRILTTLKPGKTIELYLGLIPLANEDIKWKKLG